MKRLACKRMRSCWPRGAAVRNGWAGEVARLGIETRNNEVDIGLRVEVPNSIMDRLTTELYEAKLVYYSDTFENRVRTFCMNPGGIVSEEHYEGGIAVVNGHSYHDTERRTQKHQLCDAGLPPGLPSRSTSQSSTGNYIAQLGNMLTGGGIMVQRLGDLLQGRRTDLSGCVNPPPNLRWFTAVPGDLSFVLPPPAPDQHHRGAARV